jgi:hypothetical protein
MEKPWDGAEARAMEISFATGASGGEILAMKRFVQQR